MALIALANTLLLLWTSRKVVATHDAVNGIQAQKIADAHQLGVTEGKGQ